MSIQEQVFLQVQLMSNGIPAQQVPLAQTVCNSTVSTLSKQLRIPLKPEDIREDFVMAASMLALAALSEIDTAMTPEQFTAGDITVRRGTGSAASECLKLQAQMLMAPYGPLPAPEPVPKPVIFQGV